MKIVKLVSVWLRSRIRVEQHDSFKGVTMIATRLHNYDKRVTEQDQMSKRSTAIGDRQDSVETVKTR
jgi:hypothetical protein